MLGSRVLAPGALALVLSLWSVPAPHAAPQSTQTLDGTWSSLSGGPAPGPRREYAAVYDSKQNRYFIFGGFQWTYPGPGDLLLEVWELALDTPTPTWTRIQFNGNQPGERHSPQWGYDPARNRLIVFGGYGHHYPGSYNEYLNDVWELKLNGQPQWEELHPIGTPPEGRLAGAAVYDQLRQRFVGFGGTRGLPTDTWVLDLHGQPEWVQDSLAGASPPGSYGMVGIYDQFRDRMVMFGGSTSDSYWGVHNDVWALDLASPMSWTQLQPSGALPTARRSGTAAHDLIRDRMIIYGGWDSQTNNNSSFLGDTWALSFTPDLHWTQLAPGGPIPVGRDAMGAVYDAGHDRMVLFGGWAGDYMLGDTWFLDWGTPAAEPSMTASAGATPDAASVTWSVVGMNGERAAVYRRDANSEWSLISTVENTGTGTLTFHDATVVPGARYGYLLGIPSRVGAVVGGEAWVDVPTVTSAPPTPVAFALDPVRPNPVVGRFEVSMSLLGDSPATLELVDVTGRLRASRTLAAGSPGPQTVGLGNASDFAAGVYFLRLRQADRIVSRRVILTGR